MRQSRRTWWDLTYRATRPDGNLCVVYQDMESGALMYKLLPQPLRNMDIEEAAPHWLEVLCSGVHFKQHSIHRLSSWPQARFELHPNWTRDIATGAASLEDLGQVIKWRRW